MKQVKCPICGKEVVEKEDGIHPVLPGHLLWGHPQKDIVDAYLSLRWEKEQEKYAD